MLILTVVVIVGTFVATLLSDSRPVLGLDLQGGVSIVLFPVEGSDLGALNTAVDVIRNRVDGLGIAEPDVQRQGNTIVVNLPGVKDRTKAEGLVGETAELRFRQVQEQNGQPLIFAFAATPSGATTAAKGGTSTTNGAKIQPSTTVAPSTSGKSAGLPPGEQTIATAPIVAHLAATGATGASGTTGATGATGATGGPTTTVPTKAFPGCADLIKQSPPDTDAAQQVVLPDRKQESCYVLGPAIVTGKSVKSANVIYDSNQSQFATNVKFKNNDFLDKIAGPLVGKQVAIELDGVVQSAPTINPGITGRDVEITGNFTQGEAKQLALVLRYGALPVQFDQAKQTVESVSPTLGRDQLTAGIVAGLIGLGLVALYMLAFYRLLGLVVVVGLVLTGMLFFTVVSYLSTAHGLTLTLAGVTGIIVSVGVTVDSYVVYFERLKDEVRTGKTIRSSLEPGFRQAFRTIIAADLVSLLGAAVLYVFATSSVRGFAFFLGLSTVMDLLLAYIFMHPAVSVLARQPEARAAARRRHRVPALDVQGAVV